MPMQLRRKKSEGSFYESFSDLIFCALVLFVALVMVLAANVGVQVDSLKETESTLQTVQTDLEESKEKLTSVVRSHRYTGNSSSPRLIMAIDVRANEPRYFFTPNECCAAFQTPVSYETEENAILRQRNALLAATESIEQQRGITEEELQSLMKAFSYHATSLLDSPWLGIQVEQQGNQLMITGVVPYSNVSPELVGASILELDGQRPQTFEELQSCFAGIEKGREFAKLVVEKNATRVEMDVRLLWHWYNGVQFFMLDQFSSVASGWRLAGDGLDMQETSSLLGAVKSGVSYEETVERAQDVFANFGRKIESGEIVYGSQANSETVTILQMRALETEQMLVVGGVHLTLDEVCNLLRSIAHGNVAIEFIDENNQPTSSLPKWVNTELLVPTGFMNRAPNLKAIDKWLDENASRELAL